MKTLINKFFRYLLIGAGNTFVCLAVMYLGARMGLDYLYYTALGYCVAILLSFFMNLRYTFKVEGETVKRLTLFFLTSLVNLMLVELIEYTLIESFLVNHLVAIFCGMSWYVITGFMVNNSFVYRKQLKTSQ